ncbi:MAG: hypothetical protein WCJ49_08065, partial [Deltaproteobacteria bacterium]
MSVQQKAGIVGVLLLIFAMGIGSYHYRSTPTSYEMDDFLFISHNGKTVRVQIIDSKKNNGIFSLPRHAGMKHLLSVAGYKTDTLSDGVIKNGNIFDGAVVFLTTDDDNQVHKVKIGEMGASQKLALGIPLNVNRASQDDLQMISGMGKKT